MTEIPEKHKPFEINANMQKFLGLGAPSFEESAIFQTPEAMEVDHEFQHFMDEGAGYQDAVTDLDASRAFPVPQHQRSDEKQEEERANLKKDKTYVELKSKVKAP